MCFEKSAWVSLNKINISPCYSVSLLLFAFLWDLCFPFIVFGPRNCQICAMSGINVFCHYVFSSGYFEVKTLTIRSVKVYFLPVVLTTALLWLIFIYFLCVFIVAKENERMIIISVHFHITVKFILVFPQIFVWPYKHIDSVNCSLSFLVWLILGRINLFTLRYLKIHFIFLKSSWGIICS